MTRYFTISSIIFSILILSLKDTLNIVHSLLHKIPNIFHYHIHHHHHDHSHRHDHHHYGHFEREHDIMDHIAKGTEKEVKEEKLPPEENEKKSVKILVKINWFICDDGSHQISWLSSANKKRSFLVSDLYRILLSSPPSPPPESV